MRRLWLRIHLVLGLGCGTLFALLGLSGSALVFYPELDRWLNPALQVSAPAPNPVSVDAVLARLRALHPQRQGPWRIERPLTPSTPITARYYQPVETRERAFAPLMLTLDPHTLKPTSQRFWGDYAVTWLYDLHYTLLLEGAGHTLVGVLGLLLVVSLATGLVLWWPSRQRLWRALLPWPRPGVVRRTYDLHTLAGVYGGLVLAVLAFTGAAMVFPNATREWVGAVWPVDAAAPTFSNLVHHGQPLLSLDDAVAVAAVQLPGAEVRWVQTPGIQGGPVVLRLYQTGEPGRRFPHSYLHLHPASGEVLWMQDARQRPSGARLLAWVHPLHNGEAFGEVGRWLACFAGLLPSLLLLTGWLRWQQKRRARGG